VLSAQPAGGAPDACRPLSNCAFTNGTGQPPALAACALCTPPPAAACYQSEGGRHAASDPELPARCQLLQLRSQSNTRASGDAAPSAPGISCAAISGGGNALEDACHGCFLSL
jgi:hypothetical protein